MQTVIGTTNGRPGTTYYPVSYTHLDVYKRQPYDPQYHPHLQKLQWNENTE